MMFTDFLRPMQPGEEGPVEKLLLDSFKGDDEARLVRLLRKTSAIAGEMVLPIGEDIVGYYAVSYMRHPESWMALAPVAIHPDHQGRGHGRRMIGQLTSWVKAAKQWVVVLGEPGFYTRCGFDLSRAAELSSPFPITFTLLAGPGETVPKETLKYPKAFHEI